MKKGTCKFWNSAHQNSICDAGVRYSSVTPFPANPQGIAFRYPCLSMPMPAGLPDHLKVKGKCDKFTEPTDEDLAADQAENDKLLRDIAKCAPLFQQIREQHKGRTWGGVVECPVCGGSRLHLRHAPNKHIWARCETQGCIAWVQ